MKNKDKNGIKKIEDKNTVYIRLNFWIVRQSGVRCCERTAVSHRLLLDWKNCWIAFCIKILSNMNMRIYCFMSNYTNQAGYVELRDGWKNAWRTTLERVWKKQSRNLHAPLCGIFQPNSVAVAYYGALIRAKSPTNCDTHLAESFFKQALRFICASGSTGGGV